VQRVAKVQLSPPVASAVVGTQLGGQQRSVRRSPWGGERTRGRWGSVVCGDQHGSRSPRAAVDGASQGSSWCSSGSSSREDRTSKAKA
jgi:hypothetical protein